MAASDHIGGDACRPHGDPKRASRRIAQQQPRLQGDPVVDLPAEGGRGQCRLAEAKPRPIGLEGRACVHPKDREKREAERQRLRGPSALLRPQDDTLDAQCEENEDERDQRELEPIRVRAPLPGVLAKVACAAFLPPLYLEYR